MPDQARFLARSSAAADYVSTPHGPVLRHEPEAVSADYQRELTARARSRPVAEWSKCEERILGALDHFRAVSGTSRYDRQLHAIRRTVDAAGERVRVTER